MSARVAAPSGVALAVFVAVIVNVGWGSTPVVTRLAVEDFEPLMVAVLRTAFAGLIALPILLASHQPLPVASRLRWLLFVSAVTGFVAFPILFTLGQARTSATHAAIILAALPVFTGAYAAVVERKRPSHRWMLGCGIALVGEAAVVSSDRAGRCGAHAGRGPADPRGRADRRARLRRGGAARPGRLSRGGDHVLGRRHRRPPRNAGRTRLVAADGVPDAGAQAWRAVIFLAVFTSIVGYVGWYWALAHGGIQRIATIQFIQPISGIALAALVLGERLTPALGVAAAVVLAGVWIATRKRTAADPAGPSSPIPPGVLGLLRDLELLGIREEAQPSLGREPLVDRAEPALEDRPDRRPEHGRLAVHRPAGRDEQVGVGDERAPVDRAVGTTTRGRPSARVASRCSPVRASTTVCVRSSAASRSSTRGRSGLSAPPR